MEDSDQNHPCQRPIVELEESGSEIQVELRVVKPPLVPW